MGTEKRFPVSTGKETESLVSLSTWFEMRDRPPETFTFFTVRDFSQTADLNDAFRAHVAELLRFALTDTQVLHRLTDQLGWEGGARARVEAPSSRSGRRGDWGEGFTYGTLAELEGYEIPVPKLRFKLDPNQLLPGTDIVAFRRSTQGDIVEACFVECKLRTVHDAGAAHAASTQLTDDHEKGFADILGFIGNVFSIGSSAWSECFDRYLGSRNPEVDSFRVSLIAEAEEWQDSTLLTLEDSEPTLSPLSVSVALLPELADLIDSTYADIGFGAAPTDDD